MKRLRSIIFFAFLAISLGVTAFAFWYFSFSLSEDQRAKAFPESSYQIFKTSDRLTLYLLDPTGKSGAKENFHGFSIITKTEIKARNHQNLLKRSFLKSIISNVEKTECFTPRHGLQISDGKQTLDLVISFECGKFVSYFENKKGGSQISKTAKLLFNQTLENKAGT